MRLIILCLSLFIMFSCARITSESSIVKGDIEMSLKKYDKAHDSYRNAIYESPELADGYRGMGDLTFEQKHYDEALEYYNQAIERNQKNYLYYKKRGMTYSELGQNKEALDDFNKAIRLQFFKPVDAESQKYLEQGARDLFIKRSIDRAELFYMRASMLAKTGMKARFHDELREAVAILQNIRESSKGTEHEKRVESLISAMEQEMS